MLCRYIVKKHLLKEGFGRSITQLMNREVKVRGGPTMQGGYSTSENTTDAFIKTSHLMAKIPRTLKEKLSLVYNICP